MGRCRVFVAGGQCRFHATRHSATNRRQRPQRRSPAQARGEPGIPGSRLHNPTLAARLYDLNLADEAKGTGILSMIGRLTAGVGLTLPELHDD